MTEKLDHLSTELFRDLASNVGSWSGMTPNHTNMMFHQIVLVSNGSLAAGEYKVRVNVRENNSDLEATIDTGQTLTIAGKNSAIAFFTGSISGIHLEVSTPLSSGNKITAVLSSTNADMRPSAEIPASSIDHGSLGGLSDNDHTQYLNDIADTASLDLTKTGQSISGVVLPAGVDHDSLQNFVGDEHVAHSGVSMIAGTGLSGGGDISSNRTFALDLNELSASVADLDGDFFAVVDSAGAQYKLTKANIALTGFNNDALWADDQTAAEIRALVAAALDSNVYTDAESTKMGFISITQAVDLDAIETRVNALDASVILMGTFDASVGAFPGGGTAQAGESWIASVGGTIDGVVITANDRVVAILDNASTTTYASNWHLLDYTDQVLSVAGKTGAVTLVEADITDLQSYAVIGGAHHNGFSDYVGNEHTDWGSTTRNFNTSGTLDCGALTGTTGAFSGNVSVNHTLDAFKSDIDAIQFGGQGGVWEQGGTVSFSANLYRNASNQFIYQENNEAAIMQVNNGDYSFYTAPTGTAGNIATLTNRFTILNGGNVGVGSTTIEPWHTNFLGYQFGSNASIMANTAAGGGNFYFMQNAYFDGAFRYQDANVASRYAQVAGKHIFSHVASGLADASFSWTNSLIIDASGNAVFTNPLTADGAIIPTTLLVEKSADETITNDVTLNEDSDLTLAVIANTNYRVELVLRIDSTVNSGFMWAVNVPTSAELSLTGAVGNSSSGTFASIEEGSSGAIVSGSGATKVVSVSGVLKVVGTAGNIAVKWSQQSSHADSTTLLEGSHMILTKLS